MIRQSFFVSLLLVAASGCWLSNDEVWSKVDDVPDNTLIRIGTVDPDSGSNAGGDKVFIDASPLKSDVRVWFDDKEAEVLDSNKSQVLVYSPATSATGLVSITIESDDRSGTADNAFSYSSGGGGGTAGDEYGDTGAW